MLPLKKGSVDVFGFVVSKFVFKIFNLITELLENVHYRVGAGG